MKHANQLPRTLDDKQPVGRVGTAMPTLYTDWRKRRVVCFSATDGLETTRCLFNI